MLNKREWNINLHNELINIAVRSFYCIKIAQKALNTPIYQIISVLYFMLLIHSNGFDVAKAIIA